MRSIVVLVLFILLSGCETTKCFLGMSTKEVEEARKNAYVKVYNLDYRTCYEKTENALKRIDSYIYSKKPDMFACFYTRKDTTPVGIFLKEIDPNNTQIEISSPSGAIRDKMADKLLRELEISSEP